MWLPQILRSSGWQGLWWSIAGRSMRDRRDSCNNSAQSIILNFWN